MKVLVGFTTRFFTQVVGKGIVRKGGAFLFEYCCKYTFANLQMFFVSKLLLKSLSICLPTLSCHHYRRSDDSLTISLGLSTTLLAAPAALRLASR